MNRLRHPASLRVRLLVFLLAAIALTAAVQGLLAYRSALVEADALFDYQMQQTAYALRAGLPPDARASGNALPEYQNDELIVQVWTNEGLRIFESAVGAALPQKAVLGFTELQARGISYRVFSLQTRSQVIQVAQVVLIGQPHWPPLPLVTRPQALPVAVATQAVRTPVSLPRYRY